MLSIPYVNISPPSHFYPGLLAPHRELRRCFRSWPGCSCQCNPDCYLPLLDPAASLRIAAILSLVSHPAIISTSQLHLGPLRRKVPIPRRTHLPKMSPATCFPLIPVLPLRRRAIRQRGKRRYHPRDGISSAGKARMAQESVAR
jgi:hypothetical protein